MSDNLIQYKLDVTAYGKTAMSHVFDIVAMANTKIVGYEIIRIKDKEAFVLYWTKPDGPYSSLPYEMRIHDLIPMVAGWLEHKADYGREPDIDGSVKKGWRIYNRNDEWQIAAAIQPEWIEFHK